MCISIHALLAESDNQQADGKEHTIHFYPRSPCGERPSHKSRSFLSISISIHALLAESDKTIKQQKIIMRISIHALLAESDATVLYVITVPSKFLSTLSLRRATLDNIEISQANCYFYPRSPCGERLNGPLILRLKELFLSTLSLRRATDNAAREEEHSSISIHALLAESDCRLVVMSGYIFSFLSTLSLRRATSRRY